jgi:hypothetical protein
MRHFIYKRKLVNKKIKKGKYPGEVESVCKRYYARKGQESLAYAAFSRLFFAYKWPHIKGLQNHEATSDQIIKAIDLFIKETDKFFVPFKFSNN